MHELLLLGVLALREKQGLHTWAVNKRECAPACSCAAFSGRKGKGQKKREASARHARGWQ